MIASSPQSMPDKPRIVFISSPYRGNVPYHLAIARAAARQALDAGCVPIAPHLYIPLVLDDDQPREREQGIRAALHLIGVCDEVWCFGPPTEGMSREMEMAERLGVIVRRQPLPDPSQPCWRCGGSRVVEIGGELPSFVPCPECTRAAGGL